jgi:L-rhamnose-H+ transport protein
MQPNPFMGVVYHALGAFFAATCYTPQKKTKLWAWEVYWLTQACFAWLIVPVVVAFVMVPDYTGVLANADPKVMLSTFLLSMVVGIGVLTFGLGIRYIGFSLNYAIAIGVSALVGTIGPLVWTPNGGFVWKIDDVFSTRPGQIVLAGIVASLAGIVVCGWAGALRERSGGAAATQFSFRVGVPLAVLAGALSAVLNYAFEAGAPLADAALAAGASELMKMTAIYPVALGGVLVVNLVWCLVLVRRNKTSAQLVRLPDTGVATLGFYYFMALVTGLFWYFQFFFFGPGKSNMGSFGFTSWGLQMALVVMFSNIYGWLFREWAGADKLARRMLNVGMAIIMAAVFVIGYGNYLREQQQVPAADQPPAAAGAAATVD